MDILRRPRLQADQSFKLSQKVAVVGFVLIALGIVLGYYSNLSDKNVLGTAYLSSKTGILTEFISGVFFYLYNKTLNQLNMFHNKMIASQHVAISFLSNSLMADEVKRDDCKTELSKMLMSAVVKGEQ